ncbi:MAG: MotA/TolQ/ExbB proton channel family protein [Ramlibacter sp.]|jgi:biopolymer transport protein ExbB|nr:MotA/TolQ/ExbB proton channel family protein [Ramlibacter sp.]MBK8073620.1 MotA/TolQ/ExbB proton channel family protein [Ramlibacter sp.]
MNAQFGLLNVWSQGDVVTRGVFVVLLVMSLASWIVILLKALDLRRLGQQALAARGFWHAPDFAAALDQLGNDDTPNPFRALALQGRDAMAHLLHRDASTRPQLHDSLDASEWITRSLRAQLDESIARMQSGLALLASVGSTAPFVGLFGTVWGIYHALMAIGVAGQATIDKVAGPVGEALIMTALGLAVAIPAVLGYNALVRGNKGVSSRLNRFAHDLHAYFVTGARVSAPGVAPDGANVVPMKKA